MADVTRILEAVRRGEARASDRLLVAVYDELRRLAAQRMRHEPPGRTLQATALVHEAYLRVVGDPNTRWDNRGHFFAAAAEAMRRILVEAARRRNRQKRGGGWQRRALDDADCIVLPESVDLLALDEALNRLAGEDPVKAELVKLRYFAGLSMQDAAEFLGISRATADRYWNFARAWLYHEVSKGEPPD